MSVVEECRLILRMRHSRQRRPRYFYMAPETRDALWMEVMQINGQHGCSAPLCSTAGFLYLFGLEVVMLDLLPGYVLAAETRLH